jgi:putative hydrolase of the HAD superfamily
VLFDMGGVIVELGPLDELLGLDIPADRFWPAWLSSPTVRRFERGECSPDEFGAGLVTELGLGIAPAEVVDRFRRFPRGLYPGAADLVASVARRAQTAVLSNTNALHWEQQADAPVIRGLFDRLFLSFQLGLVKPDAAIFHRVVDDFGFEPDEILFLDDNQINVDGARSVGLRAERALGVGDARQHLEQLGLLA